MGVWTKCLMMAGVTGILGGILLEGLQAQTPPLPPSRSPPPAPSAPPQMAGPAAAIVPPVKFDEFFVDKALRLDVYQVGDAKEEFITLDNIFEEPTWPENPKFLIPPFESCRYAIKVFDAASGRLIFYHDFDGLFGEYRTTTPAMNGIKRVFPRSIRFPEPKGKVKVSIEKRDNKLKLQPMFTLDVDPTDLHIIRETANKGDTAFESVKTGDPHDKVDLAFLSEGYLAEDLEKFKGDVKKMSDSLFTYEPYKSNKEKFNIYGVFRPSAERGMDEPVQRRYKSTALGASYNTFDTDRYLTIQDDQVIFRMAAQVPHDSIVVLVNTPRYGGGGITMDVCITSVDNATSPRIFVHEFGHSFAALADEYVGGVAYNDMFPEGVEPLEVNITRMLDPQNLKWKQYLTPGVALPTPEAGRGRGRAGAGATTGATTASARPPVVGAFEGAGYLAKGMYRPQQFCVMGNAGPDNAFCVACKYGIQRMIDYYAGPEAAK